MQMDIEWPGIFLRQCKNRITVPFRVAVYGAGIDATNHIGTCLHRLVHQVQRAGATQKARLGKSHNVDIHKIGIGVARCHNPFDAPQTMIGIDIHMTADMRRAMAGRKHNLPCRLTGWINIDGPLQVALIIDLVNQARPGTVRVPAHTPERLIEMRMRLDQTGQNQCTCHILDSSGGCGEIGTDGHNLTAFDQHISHCATHGSSVTDKE